MMDGGRLRLPFAFALERLRQLRLSRPGPLTLAWAGLAGLLLLGVIAIDYAGRQAEAPVLAAVGAEVAIDVRGRELPARVVPLPFYRRPR